MPRGRSWGKMRSMSIVHKPAAALGKKPAPRKTPVPLAERRPRAVVMQEICEVLAAGESLEEACRRVPDAPTVPTVLGWVEKDPSGLGKDYARARQIGYQLLGDRIQAIAAETHAVTLMHKRDIDGNPVYGEDGKPVTEQVLVPLSSDVIASKRLQVDTLKWKLSKMLPKIYGDRVTQEITGAGGGPLQVTAADLRGLSDDELATMERLLSKAAGASGGRGER